MGPRTDDRNMMRALIKNGMDVARFNFSHGSYDEHKRRMDMLKQLREEERSNTAILLDTKGPEIRTGLLKDGKKVMLKANETFRLTIEEVVGDETRVSISYTGLLDDVDKGSRILVDDGLIELEVIDREEKDIVCKILNGGELGERKGVNVPNRRGTGCGLYCRLVCTECRVCAGDQSIFKESECTVHPDHCKDRECGRDPEYR